MEVQRTNSPSPTKNLNGDGEEKATIYTQETLSLDEKLVARTKRKVDFRLLPILGAIFATSLMDRTNLANARVSGADKEIGLGEGNHYSVATFAFFIPFTLLQIPSNTLARRFRAPIYLSTIALLWGLTMLCMGFVKTWGQMAVLRALLGAFEAGFLPACIWLVSCWYTRTEVQSRMTGFYAAYTIISAFGNIIASRLSTIKADGMNGWRWILIVEGLLSCALSVLGYFLILDFPNRSTFLTTEETALMRQRVERDRADENHDPLTLLKAFKYVCDLKLWSFGVAYLCTTMAAYAYAYFAPVILVGLGFSAKNSQLLYASMLICAIPFNFVLSILSDRYRHRAGSIILQSLMAIIGLSLTGFHPNNKIRLAGAYIGMIGAEGNIPALITYQSNNVIGQSMRAYASGLQVSLAGVGGIVASVSFRQQDAPKYRLGIIVTIALQVLIIVLVGLNTLYFTYRNRQVRNGGRLIEGHPGFLYII